MGGCYENEGFFYGFREEAGIGARVYYYQTYDDRGFRTPLYSTGQKTKAAALKKPRKTGILKKRRIKPDLFTPPPPPRGKPHGILSVVVGWN
jgi:hypothetical protein